MLMPNFAIVYATCGANQRASMLSGGEMFRMWGFSARARCGMHACEHANVPRVLIWCIRSYRFIAVCSVSVRLIALALLTRMSMPPNASTVAATAAIKNLLGGDAAMRGSRKPEIMADAAFAVLTKPSRELTGKFLIDDEVLAAEGITDLSGYAVDPSAPLLPDFFI